MTFGDNVFIAPNCVFSTAGHAIDPQQRGKGLEISKPIHAGSHVWFGANVSVLPGVTIGDNAVIGAGQTKISGLEIKRKRKKMQHAAQKRG